MSDPAHDPRAYPLAPEASVETGEGERGGGATGAVEGEEGGHGEPPYRQIQESTSSLSDALRQEDDDGEAEVFTLDLHTLDISPAEAPEYSLLRVGLC